MERECSISSQHLFFLFFSLKRKLWSELIDYKRKFIGGKWCIGGDFNAIEKEEERRG